MAHLQSTPREQRNETDIAGSIAEQASSMAQQAGSAVQQGVGAVTERSGRLAESAGQVLGNFRSAVETSARSQPTTTVILAALAGFAFGAIWRTGR